jgi:uncharacterized membrane-anchored protein YhcB (DUF1043 family)
MTTLITAIVALFIGVLLGMVIMAMLCISGRAERDIRQGKEWEYAAETWRKAVERRN